MTEPTTYARLMDTAMRQPQADVEKRVRALTGDLTLELDEQLRKAYIAGVADGYRQAVVEDEKAKP